MASNSLDKRALSILSLMFLLVFLASCTSAQSSTTTPTSATTTAVGNFASVVPSPSGYTYLGCYNETTGFNQAGNVRALSGNMVSTAERAARESHVPVLP